MVFNNGSVLVQRLYAYFNVNQYPDKAMKENLAKELGLAVRQVCPCILGLYLLLLEQVYVSILHSCYI